MTTIINKAVVYSASVIIMLIIIMFCAGCSAPINDGTMTPAPTITKIQPKFIKGDIVAKTASSTDQFVLILEYDITIDKYERAFVYKNSDGSWFRKDDKTDYSDRTVFEKTYLAKVFHISSALDAPIITITQSPTPTTSATTVPPTTVTIITPQTTVATTVPTTTPTPTPTPLPTYTITVTQDLTVLPIIESFSPTTAGLNSTQLAVVINGQNFKEGVKVTFVQGATELVCINPASLDSKKISCILDLRVSNGGKVGDWDVKVLNIDGQQTGTATTKFKVDNSTPIA